MPTIIHGDNVEKPVDPQAVYFRVSNWISFGMVSLALVIMTCIAFMYWQDSALDGSNKWATGTVERLQKNEGGRHGATYTVYYAYIVDAHNYSGSDLFPESDWERLHVGQPLQIIYLDSRPYVCRAKDVKPIPKYCSH